jgi:hypothetical protein
MAYEPEEWNDVYVMLGGASAALTGLVFVALSLHLSAIGADAFQRARGHYLTFGLIYITVAATLVLLPGQEDNALGVELLIGGFVGAVVVGMPLARSPANIRSTVGFLTRVVAAAIAISLNLAAGASLIAHAGGGLYLLTAGLLLALITNVSGAWALLVGLTGNQYEGARDAGMPAKTPAG